MTSQGTDKGENTQEGEKDEKAEKKSSLHERRYGKIHLRVDMYHDGANDEALSALFGQFFPCKADYDMARDMFIYDGYCKQFDVLPEGCMAPEYDVTLEKKRQPSGLGNFIEVGFIRRQ